MTGTGAAQAIIAANEELKAKSRAVIDAHERRWKSPSGFLCLVSWNWLTGDGGPRFSFDCHTGNQLDTFSADDLEFVSAKRRAFERWLQGEGELPPSDTEEKR